MGAARAHDESSVRSAVAGDGTITKEMYENDMISAATRERLRRVRRALLLLHKTLLDFEREGFERVRGRIESSGEFLQLVLHDEWFAWLRPLSALVVQIDELLDAEEATEREADALIAQAREMLKTEEGSAGGLGRSIAPRCNARPESCWHTRRRLRSSANVRGIHIELSDLLSERRVGASQQRRCVIEE